MKHFCVITNREKDENYQVAEQISAYVEKKGGSCRVLENEEQLIGGIRHFTRVEEIPSETECALVLGGDGTMIQAAIDLVHRNIPILGINMGTVGFLTEIEQQRLKEVLDLLLLDQYTIENRIMLKETCLLKQMDSGMPEYCYALNDVVVSKSGVCRLISIRVYINDELADEYRADGLIISTPTGSTGYNLSAGGPVMVPHTQATVITPICAHSLNKRSLVVSDRDKISLEIGRTKDFQEDAAVLTVDGRNVGELVTGDRLEIVVPGEMTQLVKLSKLSFYEKMREKLNGQ